VLHLLNRLPIILLASGFLACHHPPTPGLTTIDIDEALNKRGELKLSEIAKDVEFISLHGMNMDTYVHNWSWQYFVGEKVVCMFNLKPHEFLLFSRDGNFIRKIGNIGKGPGEYIGEMLVFSVDEANETILLADNSSKKFLLYRFSGELIKEQAFRNYHGLAIAFAVGVTPDNQGNFVIKNQISPTENELCFDILVIDQNLKLVKPIQPEHPITGHSTIWIASNPIYPFGKNIRFWTPGKDTVYELVNGQPVPIYHFKISDIPSIEERMTYDNRGHVEVSKILETENFLLINGTDGSQAFDLAYDKPTGKTVRIFSTGHCGLSFGDKSGIENDLFGYSPVALSESTTICKGKMVLVLHPSHVEIIDEWLKGKLTDCLNSTTVLMPDKRDELVRLIENQDENSGPVLMVITLK
jgi:hypothetical protein